MIECEIVASRAMIHGATGIDAGSRDGRHDMWCLPRINIPGDISDAAFEAWTAGLRGWRAA